MYNYNIASDKVYNIIFLLYFLRVLNVYTVKGKQFREKSGAKKIIFQAFTKNFEIFVISLYVSACISVLPSVCQTIHLSVRPPVRPSIRSHGQTRLPVNGFSRNFIFDYLSKILRDNSSLFRK